MHCSPAALSLLSTALALAPDALLAALQAVERGAYEYWKVPKGNGLFRELAGPAEPLKQVQRAILGRLLNNVPVSPFAHGFVAGRSIVSNALVHAPTAQAVLSIDLQDAFPSVAKKRVRETIEWRLGPLCKYMGAAAQGVKASPPKRPGRADDGRFFAYEKATATAAAAAPGDHGGADDQAGVTHDFPIARETLCECYDLLTTLCTDRDRLPQGAPTSGMLLNLACARLDRLIYRAVLRAGRPQMRYTRYADDLSISDSAPLGDGFIDVVRKAVIASGFTVNQAKVAQRSARQGDLLICGIRLHRGELALPRATIKAYRALFHRALSYDADTIPPELRQRIAGTLGLLRMVYPCCPAPLAKPLQQLIERHRAWLKPPGAGTATPFSAYSL